MARFLEKNMLLIYEIAFLFQKRTKNGQKGRIKAKLMPDKKSPFVSRVLFSQIECYRPKTV